MYNMYMYVLELNGTIIVRRIVMEAQLTLHALVEIFHPTARARPHEAQRLPNASVRIAPGVPTRRWLRRWLNMLYTPA